MRLRWIFNFSSWKPGEKELVRAFASIQPEERTRLLEFKYQQDLRASLCGRLMLRRAVSLLIGLDNKNIHLGRSHRGRPYLESHPEVKMNISHAGKYTVLAAELTDFQNESVLGVDIMPLKDSRIERTDKFFHLMRRQFTDNEWKTIKSFATEEEQLACFYRHWSLKESYVKAIGTGLNVDLRTIDFKISSSIVTGLQNPVLDTAVFLNGEKTKGNFTFEEILVDQHAVSVARNNTDVQQDPSPSWTHLTPGDILPEHLTPLDEPDPDVWKIYQCKEAVKPF